MKARARWLQQPSKKHVSPKSRSLAAWWTPAVTSLRSIAWTADASTPCLRAARRQGVEASAVHAIERNDVTAGVHHAARDRDFGDTCFFDGCCNHLARAFIGQALGIANVHGMTSDRVLRWCA